LIAAAAAPRQLEFAAGRWCAHQALVLAGGPPAAIGRGALREPLWPANFAGSITHDNRFAAAAACPLHPGEQPSVGIDLIDTIDFAMFSSISTRVFSAADRAAWGARKLDGLDVAQAFAAKETAVKIVSVRAGRFIDFSEISLRPTSSRSGHVMTHAALPAPLHSRNLIVEGVLLTVATACPETP
jgi:enterobactin synthetase component D